MDENHSGDLNQCDVQSLAKYIPGGMFRCQADDQLTLVEMNDGFLKMLGYTREELWEFCHGSFHALIDPRDWERTAGELTEQMSRGNVKEIEYRIRCKGERHIWVLDKGILVHSEKGPDSYYCLLVDITEAHRAQEELRLSLERHKIIMNQTNDIVVEWDIQKDMFSLSSNWHKKFGYEPMTEQVSRRFPASSHIHPDDFSILVEIMDKIRAGGSYHEAEARIRNSRNDYLWCRLRFTTQYDESGRPCKAVGVIIDIDGEKRRAHDLLEISRRDSLTHLYNKGAVQKRVSERLKANEADDSRSALLIIDVDNFKLINDTKGHLFGDAFLIEISRELIHLFRDSDTVGRIGGDEFAVFMSGLPGMEVAQKRAEETLAAFRAVAEKMQLSQQTSCSIGIAAAPENGRAYQELFKSADCALYHAKERGKNQFAICDKIPFERFPGGPARAAGSVINTKIDSDEPNGTLADDIFSILYKSSDLKAAIPAILEIVGRQMDVSRVYIFERTGKDLYANTFEWCGEGVTSQIENPQKISMANMGVSYQSLFDENGLFYCRDIRDLSRTQFEMLKAQGIKSMLQCAIWDNGEFQGGVGFDECRASRFWTQEQVDVLAFVSKILGTFLLKQRAQEKVQQVADDLQTLLDSQDAWIYVVRPKTFELMFINRKAHRLKPEARVGMRCHKFLFGRDIPCEECPTRVLSEGAPNCTREIHGVKYGTRYTANASLITWRGKTAILMVCSDLAN